MKPDPLKLDLEPPPGLGPDLGRELPPGLPPKLGLPPKAGLGFHPVPVRRSDEGPEERGPDFGRSLAPGLLLGRAPPGRGLPLLVVKARGSPPSLRNGRDELLRPPSVRGGPERPVEGRPEEGRLDAGRSEPDLSEPGLPEPERPKGGRPVLGRDGLALEPRVFSERSKSCTGSMWILNCLRG